MLPALPAAALRIAMRPFSAIAGRATLLKSIPKRSRFLVDNSPVSVTLLRNQSAFGVFIP